VDPCTDRVDPRLERSRARAVEAALAIVRECGGAAVTMEAVAARSGVAKTTLYRQFVDREDLLFASFECLTDAAEVPEGASLCDEVEAWILRLAEALQHADFAALLPSMIEVAERSARGHALACEFAGRRRRHLVARLERAITAGELDESVDPDALVSRLVGPLFYLRYVARLPLTTAFVTDHVRATLTPYLREQVETLGA
jgi:AcrR family transcriptional regulator